MPLAVGGQSGSEDPHGARSGGDQGRSAPELGLQPALGWPGHGLMPPPQNFHSYHGYGTVQDTGDDSSQKEILYGIPSWIQVSVGAFELCVAYQGSFRGGGFTVRSNTYG